MPMPKLCTVRNNGHTPQPAKPASLRRKGAIMKEFSIVRDHSVTLFGAKSPLPVNVVYGEVAVGRLRIQYIFHPSTSGLSLYMGDWNRHPKDGIASAAQKAVNGILNAHKEEWAGLGKEERCLHLSDRADRQKAAKHNTRLAALEYSTSHRVEGGPMAKRHQNYSDFVRYKGSCYSQRSVEGSKLYSNSYWEETQSVDAVPGVVTPEFSSRHFDAGQDSAGPAAFVVKHNSMPALDRTHGKSDKPERPVVTMPEKYQKPSKLAYGAEYAVWNESLSSHEAYQAMFMGGTSQAAKKKLFEQI